MANELQAPGTSSNAPAHGHRGLAWLASNPQAWTIERAIELAGSAPAAAIVDALARIDADLAPVPSDPDQRQAWSNALDERLRRLAVKIAPGMSPEQGKPWREVIVEALEDLPAMISLTAAKKAIHRPMKFMNEVEGVVREIAAELLERRRLAKIRLDALRREIEGAATPKLEDRSSPPLTLTEIGALSPELRKMGLNGGFITQEQLDEADRIREKAA